MKVFPTRLRMMALCTTFLIQGIGALAQPDTSMLFALNGAASENSCNCYTLTPSAQYQGGSVWNKTEIDLTQSFDFYFNVFLGCRSNKHGADGLAFVLQPLSTRVGNNGEGLGFQGIVPSLGIEIDTYQNWTEDDPPFDHISFQANGDVNHGDSNNLAGPVQALADSSNIKDCAWHVMEVKWDAATFTLTAYIDGSKRLSMTKDIVAIIFHRNSKVYWGFTAATGSGYNLQEFCTSLNAHFTFPMNQGFCENQPVQFLDSSVSFGPLLKWHWDFGDGTGSNLQNPPLHYYAAPGTYTVTQSIQGTDVCLSDTNKTTVKIGTPPKADFAIKDACTERPLQIANSSTDSIGTITAWHWSLSNGDTFSTAQPNIKIVQPGTYQFKLVAFNDYGCQGSADTQTVIVFPTPNVSFGQDSGCVDKQIVFTGNDSGNVSIRQWYWIFANSEDSGQSVKRTFTQEGPVSTSLWAETTDGCISDTFTRAVDVQQSHAFAGNDTIVALGYPIQLHATGGSSFVWSPSTGLDDPDIPDPVATISKDQQYTVTASTSAGCTSSAGLSIKVYKGPDIYVPGAFTPNGDGINDYLRITAPGIRQLDYFQVFNRWGNEVFHTNDVHTAWDGTFAGKPQPAGTYVWMVRCTDLNGRTITKQGTVVLIR